MQIQLLLAASAISLKGLTLHPPVAKDSHADANIVARSHFATLNACLRALAPDQAATSTTAS